MKVKENIRNRLSLLGACLLTVSCGPGLLLGDASQKGEEKNGDGSFCSSFSSATLHDHIGGDGSLGNPYAICTAAQMASIAANTSIWSMSFIVHGDIDLSSVPEIQIGNSGTAFTGSFDGGGNTFSNFTYSLGGSYGGLFGIINSGMIINLSMTSMSITNGGGSTGGMVGLLDSSSSITNCSVQGTITSVTGGVGLGGLVGTSGGNISQSHTDVTIVSLGGMTDIGGLVGIGSGTTVIDCYAIGNVVSNGTYTAGLVGRLPAASSVIRSYATGTVNTSTAGNVGGLVGATFGSGSITDSFSTGDVTGDSVANDVGLILGSNGVGTFTNNFYLSTDTCTNSGGGGCNSLATGLGPESYFFSKINAPMASWNFVTVWLETSSYPGLL